MKKYQIILISFAALLLMIGAVGAVEVDDIANDTIVSDISGSDVLVSDNYSDVVGSNKEFDGNTFSELQTTINGCNDDDTIFLNNDITQDGTKSISINKQLTIDGKGHTIDAQQKSGIFKIEDAGNVILKNIIFKNAKDKEYAAVYVYGTDCTIENCTFKDNVGKNEGGAIYASCQFYMKKTSNIVNCNFINNSAKNGGAIFAESYINVTECSFVNNSATNHGSAIYARENADINNCDFINGKANFGGAISIVNLGNIKLSRFINNSATFQGGAIYIDESYKSPSNITIEECILKDNHATSDGGAIYSQADNLNINNCSFIKNSAENGGAVVLRYTDNYNNGGSVTGSMFINNSAENGGSIYNQANADLINNTFKHNQADMGGAVYCDFYTNLIYCNFENNLAENGGAVFNKKNISLTFSNFTENNAQKGGAIYYTDYMGTLNGVEFKRNSAVDGGAIYLDGVEGEIKLNKFMNNTASANGGAVFLNSCNQVDFNYNSLFNNSAKKGGAFYTYNSNTSLLSGFFRNNAALKGGAIYSSNSTNMMEYCSFEYNEANDGGAILLNNSQSNITGSYFEFNTAFEKGSAIYWVPLTLNVSCSISSCQFFNNKVKTYNLTSNVTRGILYLELAGWNNYINAIYADSEIELKDVTYRNENETNTDAEAYNTGASGQKIILEIYDSDNNLVINTTLVTNTFGQQYYNLFLWDDGYYTYRAYLSDSDYYTYAECSGNFTLSRSASSISLNITDYDEFKYNECVIPFSIINRTDIRAVITNEDGSVVYYDNVINQYSRRVTVNLAASEEYYRITVYNLPNGRYLGSEDSKLFKIIKTGSSISINTINDIEYGRSILVSFNVDNRTDILVTVYDENENGVLSTITETDFAIIPVLNIGKYYIYADNMGNENITKSSNSSTFNILKATNIINITANDVYYGNKTVITVSASFDGNYTIDVNGSLMNVKVMRGQGQIELDLPSGDYYANVIFNNPNYNALLTNDTFTVLKADNDVRVLVNNEIGNKAIITILAQADGGYIIDVNGSLRTVRVIGGQGKIELNLPSGEYYANAIFKNPNYNTIVTNATFEVLKLCNVEVDYNDDIVSGENIVFTVKVDDDATGSITLRFADKEYNATIADGSAVIEILNAESGNHTVSVIYNGDENYAANQIDFNVTVKAYTLTYDLLGSGLYSARLSDEEGNGISNREVLFSIDGKTFKSITDNNGIATVSPDLTIGSHNIEIIYMSINITKKITVPSRFSGNKDITMFYFDGSKYTFNVYGDDGKLAGANQEVVIKLNKKTYTLKTDKNGRVSFTIPNTVKIGTHDITVTYKGESIKNTVKVKQILSSKKTVNVKRTAKKLVLTAKLKKKLAGKKIVFKFKGKKYVAKTNNKGIAKVTVKKNVIKKLKRGKTYNVNINYYKISIKTKVKVK